MSGVSPDRVDTDSTSSLQPVSGDPFEAGAFQPTSLDEARGFYDKFGQGVAALTAPFLAAGDYMQGKISAQQAQRQAFNLATNLLGGGLTSSLEREGLSAASGGLASTLDQGGAGVVGGGLRDSLQATAPLDGSLASKNARIYNPPVRPSRPFEADYPPEDWPGGPPTDKQGYLTYSIDGQPLTARYVIGRNTVGGADTPLLPEEYDAITIGSIGKTPQALPENQMPRGVLGFYRPLPRPGQPSLGVLDTLSPEYRDMVIAHEIGHIVDDLTGTIPTRGLYQELPRLYNHLNNPNRFSTNQGVVINPPPVTPENFGYYSNAVPREYMAEAIRAYMADPNYIKTVAPQTAERIRRYVNSEPRLNHVIQFNSGGSPVPPVGASLAPLDSPSSRPTIDQSQVYSPTNPGGFI